jgi:UDP-glucose 4-epimerase
MIKSRVLILGSKGFIGSLLIKTLDFTGNVDIFGIDSTDIDLTDTYASQKLISYMDNHEIDSVIILAATKRQDGDSVHIMNSNNIISRNIVTSLSAYKKNIYCIYVSSMAVYGEQNNQELFTEDSDIRPTSFYGKHKIYSEKLYRAYLDNFNLTIFRPPLVYSHASKEGYHPGGFYAKAVCDKEIILWGDGTELREFIHIYDMVDILIKSLQLKPTGTFNICSGSSLSYSNIIEYLHNFLDFNVKYNHRSLPKVDHTYNPEKFIRTFGNYNFITPYSSIKFHHFSTAAL